MSRTLSEIELGVLKSAITDGGCATAEVIGARLGWITEQLAVWLRQPALSLTIDEAEMAALRCLQERGITCRYIDYVSSLPVTNTVIAAPGRVDFDCGDRHYSYVVKSGRLYIGGLGTIIHQSDDGSFDFGDTRATGATVAMNAKLLGALVYSRP